MCCFNYISMVMSGNVYCSTHAYCGLHGIIQHIYKVFHQLKQCTASYNQLTPVLCKTGLDWSKTGPGTAWTGPGPSPCLKTRLDQTFKPYEQLLTAAGTGAGLSIVGRGGLVLSCPHPIFVLLLHLPAIVIVISAIPLPVVCPPPLPSFSLLFTSTLLPVPTP